MTYSAAPLDYNSRVDKPGFKFGPPDYKPFVVANKIAWFYVKVFLLLVGIGLAIKILAWLK